MPMFYITVGDGGDNASCYTVEADDLRHACSMVGEYMQPSDKAVSVELAEDIEEDDDDDDDA